MPALVNQTVTIVNKSGKIVSTSKHLVNVFNEAKSAYNERKAEIRAMRNQEKESKDRERKARKQLEALALEDQDDKRSHASSRKSSRKGSEDVRSVRRKPVPSHAGTRPPLQRGASDSIYANDRALTSYRPSPLPKDSGLVYDDDEPIRELTRRNTDGMQLKGQRSDIPRRRRSYDDIDMDLAYGELPPPPPESKREDEIELKEKINYLQVLLDEGNCMQHSVTAIIDNLQKNPDALAAVALTLAEISNLAAKMAPGALAAMKTSFPAVVALLASPQFAIAAGVGVGVTIIAFGGYKIIKKIQANKSDEKLVMPAVEGERELGPVQGPLEEGDTLREISRIEMWRRGIADEQAQSVGTSVDGEFITPLATRTMIDDGRLTEADLLPLDAKSERSSRSKRKSKKSKSEVSGKSSRTSKTKAAHSQKEPSVFKNLFTGRSEMKRRERESVLV